MKLTIFLASTLLITSSAHALTVGDSATYNVLTEGQNHSLVQTVTLIDGDTYTVSTLVDGTPGQDQTGSVSELAQMNSAYANCAQYSGDIESITVGAGTFSTCHISQNGEDLYLSPSVALGIVELVTVQTIVNGTAQGANETATLVSFIQQ